MNLGCCTHVTFWPLAMFVFWHLREVKNLAQIIREHIADSVRALEQVRVFYRLCMPLNCSWWCSGNSFFLAVCSRHSGKQALHDSNINIKRKHLQRTELELFLSQNLDLSGSVLHIYIAYSKLLAE